LGIAAHDIRGPLTIIQGNAELMRLRLDQLEPAALDRSLGVIHDAAKGLSQLLSELLDTRAMESGKIKLYRRAYSVRRLLEEACAVGRLAADDNRIGMVIEADSALQVEVDPRRLGQAISNLVLNAIKFSRSGTSILIRAGTLETGECEIAVTDQGAGIPADELAKVFTAFERGRVGKRKLGSGLGLMIAKSLVEQHGGSLTVESQVGAGSCFRITLPRAA
jgi:signal transduction histidine kinase